MRFFLLLSVISLIGYVKARHINTVDDGNESFHVPVVPISEELPKMSSARSERRFVYVEPPEAPDDYRSEIDRLLREIQEDWQANERDYREMAKGDGIVARVIRGEDLDD